MRECIDGEVELFRTSDLVGYEILNITAQRAVERENEDANRCILGKAYSTFEASGAKLTNTHQRCRGLATSGGPPNHSKPRGRRR